MPTTEQLTAMGQYNESLVKAGITDFDIQTLDRHIWKAMLVDMPRMAKVNDGWASS